MMMQFGICEIISKDVWQIIFLKVSEILQSMKFWTLQTNTEINEKRLHRTFAGMHYFFTKFCHLLC